jgi:hypothetical protein
MIKEYFDLVRRPAPQFIAPEAFEPHFLLVEEAIERVYGKQVSEEIFWWLYDAPKPTDLPVKLETDEDFFKYIKDTYNVSLV